MTEGRGVVATVGLVPGNLHEGKRVVRIRVERGPEQALRGIDVVPGLRARREDEPRPGGVAARGGCLDGGHERLEGRIGPCLEGEDAGDPGEGEHPGETGAGIRAVEAAEPLAEVIRGENDPESFGLPRLQIECLDHLPIELARRPFVVGVVGLVQLGPVERHELVDTFPVRPRQAHEAPVHLETGGSERLAERRQRMLEQAGIVRQEIEDEGVEGDRRGQEQEVRCLLLGETHPGRLNEAADGEPGLGPRLGAGSHTEEHARQPHVHEVSRRAAGQPARWPLERNVGIGAAGIECVLVPQDRERPSVGEQQAVGSERDERGEVRGQGEDLGRRFSRGEKVAQRRSTQQLPGNRPPPVAEPAESLIDIQRT